MSATMVTSCPVTELGTGLARVRCAQPAAVERMGRSLAQHGQLTPVVTVPRAGKQEIVDGLKRHAAAISLGWPELVQRVAQLDEAGQWAAMLALNRGSQSMMELEEALVLRELASTGLTQVQMAELVQRHKSWVSRRIGLVERLHPELVEGMRLGLVHPGVARRLLPLPPGNQLEVAAAAQNARLGPRDTELLVSLWQRAQEPEVRSFLLREPRAALDKAHPELAKTPQSHLSLRGQRLWRLLRLLQGVTPRTVTLLSPPPEPERRMLLPELRATSAAITHLQAVLGSSLSAGSDAASAASAATPAFAP